MYNHGWSTYPHVRYPIVVPLRPAIKALFLMGVPGYRGVNPSHDTKLMGIRTPTKTPSENSGWSSQTGGCQPKNRGKGIYPKMDGESNGKPNFLMDDLGVQYPFFWKHPCQA